MSALTQKIGERIRSRRLAAGLTIRQLAEASGLSARYVTSAEHGQANLSVEKMSQLCTVLQIPLSWLVSEEARGAIDACLMERSQDELNEILSWLRDRFTPQSKPLIALLGVRGAGKTTIGRQLASLLDRSFVELDERIAQLADLNLAEIFAVHGEGYYRKLEREALASITASGQAYIVATGGGIVTDAENFARLRDSATTIWLKARPEDHWDRVIKQGDRRPMRDHPHAMAELRSLLTARSPLYGLADHIVDTSGRASHEVTDEICEILGGV